MIIDVRTYNIVPRKMKTYLALFEEYALPIQRRHIGDPLGYFVVEHGPLHQVVHFWGYDNLADLEMRRAKRDADPEWTDYQRKTEGLVVVTIFGGFLFRWEGGFDVALPVPFWLKWHGERGPVAFRSGRALGGR